MANETNVDVSATLGNLSEAVTKIGQMQIELLDKSVKTAASALESLTPALMDAAGNLTGMLNQVLQGISTAIAPKQ